MKRVLSLGAGIQSSTLLLMSIKGELPMLDAWVFSDTQYEPKAVYTHLKWLQKLSDKAGIKGYIVTAGNLREDALEFRQHRKSSDGKRYASIPFFIKNEDESMGKLPRQCTKEYKIIPVEKVLRREIMGLEHGETAPKTPQIEQWFGISCDEMQRAKPPGIWKNPRRKKTDIQVDLFGDDWKIKVAKKWHAANWKTHVYPLLDCRLLPNRKSEPLGYLPYPMSREDCVAWLKKVHPKRKFPRSACVCCPFRTNEEWLDMKDNRPEEFADVVEFDHGIRIQERSWRMNATKVHKPLAGSPFVHRQLIPLDQVDFGGEGERTGGGCGTLTDDYSGGLCGT